MRQVDKDEFRIVFFKYGKASEGYGQGYWDRFFESEPPGVMSYWVEEPPSPEHDRMMIVTDAALRQHRLFFMTDEAEESFFGS